MMNMATLRIGELAAAVGLNPKTIRYYEQIGLLPTPARTQSGYRRYDADDGARLRFIAKAKTLGLSLGEIGAIMMIRRGGESPCQHVVNLIDQKLAAIDDQLRLLTGLRCELETMRQEAQASAPPDAPICAIIEQHHSPQPPGPASASSRP